MFFYVFFFFKAEDGIRVLTVTGVQTCALPISRLGAGRHGRFSLGSLGSDDDGVRQTLRAALVAEDLVGLGPAGAFERDLLQLVLEFFLRELAALQPRTRLDDLFDVKLENIAPAELALGPFALS